MNLDTERYKLCLDCLSGRYQKRGLDAYSEAMGNALALIGKRINSSEAWENVYLSYDAEMESPLKNEMEQKLCFNCQYILEHVTLSQEGVETKIKYGHGF